MPIASSLLEKPRLVKKLRDFYDYVKYNDGKVGTKTRGIDLNFNNACNLRCKYCFTNSPKGDHVKEYLDYDAIARLADEADELGYFEFDLQGGELLLQPKKLFKVLEAIKPERFYLYLTTNGYYLDEDMAQRLAKAGVSRVSVSIDSMDEKIHDEIRGRKDSWRRAMEGLKHVQNAGIDPYLNITVGHYNAHTDHLKQLLDYSKDQKYRTLLNVADGATAGGGKILQVISATKTDVASNSTGSGASDVWNYNNSDLRVQITASDANHKFLIMGSVTTSSGASVHVIVRDNGTNLVGLQATGQSQRRQASSGHDQSDSHSASTVPIQGMITAGDTNQHTFHFAFNHTSGSTQDIYINRGTNDGNGSDRGRYVSTITVMEIEA